MIQLPLEILLEKGLGEQLSPRVYGEEIRMGGAVDDALNVVNIPEFREELKGRPGGQRHISNIIDKFLSFSPSQMSAYFDDDIPLYFRMSSMIGQWQIEYLLPSPVEDELTSRKLEGEPSVDEIIARIFTPEPCSYNGTQEESDKVLKEGYTFEIIKFYFQGRRGTFHSPDITIENGDGPTRVISHMGVSEFPSIDPNYEELTMSLSGKQEALQALLGLDGKHNEPEVIYKVVKDFLYE